MMKASMVGGSARSRDLARDARGAIDVLAPLAERDDTRPYVSRRLGEAALSLFRALGALPRVDGVSPVARLEAGAREATNRDLDLLEEVLKQIDDEVSQIDGDPVPELRESLDRASTVLTETIATRSSISPMELALRLEWTIEWAITRAVRLLPHSAFAKRIEALVLAKLPIVPDNNRALVWGRVVHDAGYYGSASRPPELLAAHGDILPNDFLSPPTSDERDRRIAAYVTRYRPRLMDAAFAAGESAVPSTPLALANVLSWVEDVVELDELEKQLVESVNVMAYLLSSRGLAVQRREEIAAALGLSTDSRLVQALPDEPQFRSGTLGATPAVITPATAAVLTVAELRRLLSLVELFADAAPEPAVDLLLRYRLSQEVRLRDSPSELRSMKELQLQASVAAFLIEHGVYAVGTEFGRSRTDLVVAHDQNALVIEAKKYTKRPSETLILKNYTQLRTYMEQHPDQSRGVLLMFNFSDIPIHAPRVFLCGGRVLFIAVNLCTSSPSKLSAHIQIEASDGVGPGFRAVHVQVAVPSTIAEPK